MYVRRGAVRNLVARHLTGTSPNVESLDTVKVGVGLIATMTALVLGLVIASAKSSFDAVDKAMKRTANEILALDRVHKLSQNFPQGLAPRV